MKTSVDLQNLMNKINSKTGAFTITLIDGQKVKVKLNSMKTNIDVDGFFQCALSTYTNDINKLTTYDIYDITPVRLSVR